MRKRAATKMSGASIPFALALHHETNGWDDAEQQREFWDRDDVPERLRGERPERPDPRVLLTDDETVLAEYARAKAEWQMKVKKLNGDRIAWLRRAAQRERG
jgi:hypothetical protein